MPGIVPATSWSVANRPVRRSLSIRLQSEIEKLKWTARKMMEKSMKLEWVVVSKPLSEEEEEIIIFHMNE